MGNFSIIFHYFSAYCTNLQMDDRSERDETVERRA